VDSFRDSSPLPRPDRGIPPIIPFQACPIPLTGMRLRSPTVPGRAGCARSRASEAVAQPQARNTGSGRGRGSEEATTTFPLSFSPCIRVAGRSCSGRIPAPLADAGAVFRLGRIRFRCLAVLWRRLDVMVAHDRVSARLSARRLLAKITASAMLSGATRLGAVARSGQAGVLVVGAVFH